MVLGRAEQDQASLPSGASCPLPPGSGQIMGNRQPASLTLQLSRQGRGGTQSKRKHEPSSSQRSE